MNHVSSYSYTGTYPHDSGLAMGLTLVNEVGKRAASRGSVSACTLGQVFSEYSVLDLSQDAKGNPNYPARL